MVYHASKEFLPFWLTDGFGNNSTGTVLNKSISFILANFDNVSAYSFFSLGIYDISNLLEY